VHWLSVLVLVSLPFVVLVYLPLLCWCCCPCCTHLAAGIALVSLLTLRWGCCPSYTGVLAFAVLASLSLLHWLLCHCCAGIDALCAGVVVLVMLGSTPTLRWHQNIVFICNQPGKSPIWVLSREGIAQGCSLSMNLYGVALFPLLERMQVTVPDALALAYTDDTAAAGKAVHNAECLSYLLPHGLRYSYFPDPGKSWYICKAEDEAVAQQAFEANDLVIQFSCGQRYLGSFIGSNASKSDWLGSMVTMWVAAVETLAILAGNYPQAAYARFTFYLQNEWQYVQRVTSDMAPHSAPLEVAIRTKFLLALLGIATLDLDGEFCKLLTHSVKTGGIAIQYPVDTAMHVHKTSLRTMSHLLTSMVDKDAHLDLEDHRKCVVRWGLYGRTEHLGREQKTGFDAGWGTFLC
jgi:hypothetical protein